MSVATTVTESKVFSNGGGIYVAELVLSNGKSVKWIGPVHIFSYQADLATCIKELVNEALAAGGLASG